MTDFFEDDEEWISKTQRKHECEDLQKLGEELLTLKDSELETFHLPDTLYAAILETRKIHKHGALKRKKQFIGKLMRDIDAEEIAQKLNDIRHKEDLHNAHFKRLEHWRDRILADGDNAINEFLAEHPNADRQLLRQLHRNSIKEQKANKPPAAARQIFKYIREISETTSD